MQSLEELFYTGIGSRKTPAHICQLFTKIAMLLKEEGYVLRSGGAEGADKAFELGAGDKAEVFRPHHATAQCLKIAEGLIPWWQKMDDYAQKLHARNVQQILGKNLDSPVKFVLCWTPDGKEIGGTRTAIVLAHEHHIPVFNFFNEQKTLEQLIKFLENKRW